jgi:hypothetical protein
LWWCSPSSVFLLVCLGLFLYFCSTRFAVTVRLAAISLTEWDLNVNGFLPFGILGYVLVQFPVFGEDQSGEHAVQWSHDLRPHLQLALENPSGSVEPPLETNGLQSSVSRAGNDSLPAAELHVTRAEMSSAELRRLLRPTFKLGSQWYAESGDFELATYEIKATMPLFPIFGPPPPLLSAGFNFTDLESPAFFDLPSALYEVPVGLSWMRRVNERWMIRSMLGSAYASDGKNNSSDAWQFRGGAFAIYSPNDRWTWTFGALALGRSDIPVVPAIGAVYRPNRRTRYDLIFPRPRASWLVADHGLRQHWGYLGGGLGGGTWAYESMQGIDDRLSYRDWQVLLGWESTPRSEPGVPFTRGRKFGAEVGFAFGRQLEFENGRADRSLSDALLLRAKLSF